MSDAEPKFALTGVFEVETRPNAEIITYSGDVEELRKVERIIGNFIDAYESDDVVSVDQIREHLEDEFSVNCEDLESVDCLKIYQLVEVME